MTNPLKIGETRKRGQKIAPGEIDKLVGMRIRIARNMLGKKQEELANYLGLTLQQTQKYENGKNKISVNILLKVSQYFNIPISYFIPNKVGKPEENIHYTMQALEDQYSGQHKVAEEWKPIGYSKSTSEAQNKKILLEIIKILTSIVDFDKQKKVLEFVQNLQNK